MYVNISHGNGSKYNPLPRGDFLSVLMKSVAVPTRLGHTPEAVVMTGYS